MKNKIANIIFDYGGTLDTDGVHWSEKFWEVYRHFGVPLEKKDFREAYVHAERTTGDFIRPESGLRDTCRTQLMNQLAYLEMNHLLTKNYALPVDQMAGYCLNAVLEYAAIARQTMALLEREYILGLVSNYYGNVETVLKETGLRKYFRAVIDSAVVGIRKPDPRIFELALDKMGGRATETLVVGDSYDNDIEPAKQLGCATAWLSGKGWRTPERTDHADAIIKSVRELPAVIKAMWP